MKRITPFLVPLGLLAACGKGEQVHHAVIEAAGAMDVFCDTERGDFIYVGDPDHEEGGPLDGTFDVTSVVWADHGGVDKKIASVDWGVEYIADPGPATNDVGGLLDMWGRSERAHSGVDHFVTGRRDMDIELVLLDGSVELWDVRGTHLVTAEGVFGAGISGDLDLYASDYGMSLDLRPEPGDEITLQAYGDVSLWIPYGLDLDLEVIADIDWGVTVSDLGFDDLVVLPDYVHAVKGEGTIPIRVDVEGGAFSLFVADPTTPEAR
ncbi:MAG: hypothetical protein H6738_14180 [Alphaproteobacteria bacterium]|nr:hypothetical protein [Alphaproteobacteria bacterium]MCB9697923.1 hypothetical protein [Alphaproteobacteria bacterium]